MSSIAAFSFGALGDFVALLDLARKVRKTLNDSSGGSHDYIMILVEVDSLVRVLQMATAATTSAQLSQLSPALVQTCCNALKLSHDVLNILWIKVMNYQDRLRRGGSERMMMESWRKIGWSLLNKDNEVNKLRWQLSYHARTIQVVISFAQWYAVELFCYTPQPSPPADYLWLSVTTYEMGQQTRRTLVDCLTRHLPISIGYTWEGGATADTAPIRLRDMYDHIVDVPLDLCATPEVL